MQRFGGVATRMQQNSVDQTITNKIYDEDLILNQVTFLVGKPENVKYISDTVVREPFDNEFLAFLNEISKILMSDRAVKVYPDIITFAFWIRKSSTAKLKERFQHSDEDVCIGKGTVFHIAPSNVPVNYAYSLVAGLLTGNANIVRVPYKDFPQIQIINKAIREALNTFTNISPYINLVRYEHSREINDLLSSKADMRVIWGGDTTIAELRKSPLPPRSGEITFADRYSLAVIDSDAYMENADKCHVAVDFYNDTYLTDQNACTSPRVVVWTGSKKKEAKELFWNNLYELVKKQYSFQSIQGINKLTSSFLAAVAFPGIKVISHQDNLLVRVQVQEVSPDLMKLRDNSGYFFEYDCEDILEIRQLCNNKKCQTIGYIGDKSIFLPLVQCGVNGIDRVVPIGKTMEFDLIWDGYNLVRQMTRVIKFS